LVHLFKHQLIKKISEKKRAIAKPTAIPSKQLHKSKIIFFLLCELKERPHMAGQCDL